MATQERRMTALFRNSEDAENAYNELLRRGFRQDEINVITSEETRNTYYSSDTPRGNYRTTETGNKAAEGTGVGAAIGGTVGAIIGALAAIGTSVLLPGLGLIVAGPLAAALVGAGAGGATGGLVGALIGWGIPEEHATAYETGLREGGTILGFIPRNDTEAQEVQDVWEKYNGELIYR